MNGLWARWALLLVALCVSVLAESTPAWADGELDPDFDGDGKVITDFGGEDNARAVLIQGDGKIVAIGYRFSSLDTSDIALARYNPDGSLDSSFNGGGKLTTDLGGDDRAHAAAIQTDGKIVAVGSSNVHGVSEFVLVRYHPDGSLDASFGGDGVVTTYFDGSSSAQAVTLLGDGRIIAAGFGPSPSFVNRSNFALARYNPDGTMDISFDGDGKVTTDLGWFINRGQAVALLNDGRIIVAGYGLQSNGSKSAFALARYNPDGSVDTTFDGDGTVTTGFGGYARAHAVALPGDDKVIAIGGGDDYRTLTSGFTLARYNPDGSLDASFAGEGMVTTDFGGSAYAATLQADGKIVVAGADFAFSLARFYPDGSLDSSFGAAGTVTTDFEKVDQADTASAYAIALQSDGKIVAAGSNGHDFALARYQGARSEPTSTATATPTYSPTPVGTEAIPLFLPIILRAGTAGW